MNRILAGASLVAVALTLNGCGGVSGTFVVPIPETYTATDITPGTVGGIVPNAIIDSGLVAGTYRPTANAEPIGFIWSPSGGFQALGTLGGATSQVLGLSPSGVPVGSSQDQNGVTRAVRFEGTTPVPLVSFSNNTTSSAHAMNVSGSIVGSALDLASLVRPVKYPEGGASFPIVLGSFGGADGVARAINVNGTAVGYATNAQGIRRAFLAGNNNFADLTPLGGVASDAFDINDNGEVVGRTTDQNGRTQAFLFQLGSTLPLPGFSGEIESVAYGINAQRVIVGSSTVGDQKMGTVWFGRQQPIDLNTKVELPGTYMVTEARAIDDLGRIVVVAEDDLGRVKAFVLTPD